MNVSSCFCKMDTRKSDSRPLGGGGGDEAQASGSSGSPRRRNFNLNKSGLSHGSASDGKTAAAVRNERAPHTKEP